MNEYRIVKRAGLFLVHRRHKWWWGWGPWHSPFMADNPHSTLNDARWWRQRLMGRDPTIPIDIVE